MNEQQHKRAMPKTSRGRIRYVLMVLQVVFVLVLIFSFSISIM